MFFFDDLGVFLLGHAASDPSPGHRTGLDGPLDSPATHPQAEALGYACDDAVNILGAFFDPRLDLFDLLSIEFSAATSAGVVIEAG